MKVTSMLVMDMQGIEKNARSIKRIKSNKMAINSNNEIRDE